MYNRSRKNFSYHEHNRPELCDAKTEKSNRTICIPEVLCKIIGDYRESATVMSRHIINIDGQLFNPESFSKAISRRAGVSLRLHDLRHLYASFLVKNDVNLKIVQEQLGHNDFRVTMNTYAHLRQEEKNPGGGRDRGDCVRDGRCFFVAVSNITFEVPGV